MPCKSNTRPLNLALAPKYDDWPPYWHTTLNHPIILILRMAAMPRIYVLDGSRNRAFALTPDIFDASSPTARRRSAHTLVQLLLTCCLSIRFKSYPTDGQLMFLPLSSRSDCRLRRPDFASMLINSSPGACWCLLALVRPRTPVHLTLNLTHSPRSLAQRRSVAPSTSPLLLLLVWGGAFAKRNALRPIHYAQTTICELSLWVGVSGLRFVAPPQLSPIQSWSTRSEPDCDSVSRTQRTPRLVGSVRPEPLRPERPSRSPSGSSPTPRISILACLLLIEIRATSVPYHTEQIDALAYLRGVN
ncbi:hypothetical protein B0H13DRAFT_2317383 [Mycena leptocephala]|nr:hypothetical protein B0H13DRAFT_2317383 [Mycena leptocephala]